MTTKSLTTKLKITILIIALAPVLMAALLVNYIQTDTLKQSMSRLGTELRRLNNASVSLSNRMNHVVDSVNDLAASPKFIQADEKLKAEMIRNRIGIIPSAVYARYYDKDKKPLLELNLAGTVDKTPEEPGAGLLDKALKGQTTRSGVVFDQKKRPVMNLAVPVKSGSDGRIRGVIAVNISLNEMFKSLESGFGRKKGIAYVVDRNREIVYVTGQLQKQFPKISRGAKTEYRLLDGQEMVNINDKVYLISNLPIPNTDWKFVWQAPIEELSSFKRGAALTLTSILILTLLTVSLVSFYMARKVSGPLERLLEAMGNLGKEIVGEDITPKEDEDEIDALEQSFEEVRIKLKKYMAERKALYSKTRERLEKKVKELQAIHSITEAFTTHSDVPGLLDFIVVQLGSIFDAGFCCLYLQNGSEEYRLKACKGIENRDKCCIDTFPIDREPFDEILETRNVLVVHNAHTEDFVRERFPDVEIDAYCALPLFLKDNLFGILEVALGKDRDLTEGDINLLVTLAKEASIAIQNARLYETVLKKKEQVERILSTISDGVVTMDSEYKIISFNKSAEEITGFNKEDVVGKKSFELFRGLSADMEERQLICTEMECILQTAYEQQQFPLSSEHVLTNAQGQEKTLEFSTNMEKDDESGNAQFFSVFRDISRYKELERLRADFIDTISHELRTPLTSIKGYVSTLLHPRARFSSEEINEFLEIINDETNRLTRMINDLLDASRLHRDALSLKPQPFRLNKCIADLVVKFKATTTTHKFLVDMQGTPIMYGDLSQVEFVINHLLENAVKYSPEGGNIKISVEQSGESDVLVMIEDEGIGVPEEHREKIFNLFHRVDNRSIRKVYGPGLGLFLSKKIIEAHNRKIWVESGLNGGSKFAFKLPLYNGPEPEHVHDGTEE